MKKRTMRIITWALVSAALLAACGSGCCGGGMGGGLPQQRFVTNGTVNAIVVASDGTTYIGGSFTQVGPATDHGVPIDATTGLLPGDRSPASAARQ